MKEKSKIIICLIGLSMIVLLSVYFQIRINQETKKGQENVDKLLDSMEKECSNIKV